MTDGDALLATVLEHPADDTHRLVYADWLQEHGQEARADLIRTMIEHSDQSRQCRSPYDSDRPDPLRCGKCPVCRVVSMFHTHFREWTPNIRCTLMIYRQAWCRQKLMATTHLHVTRGFVSGFETTIVQFFAYVNTVFATHPVERVFLPTFRAEVRPSGSGHGWRISYHLPEKEKAYFAMSDGLETRAEMVARLIQDVEDLQAEFA